MSSSAKEGKDETLKDLKEILSLLDDIRQEAVDNKEQSAKIVAQNDQIIEIHKEMLEALKSINKTD